MSAGGRFTIRILNGLHEGAEMKIPAGGVVVGNDEKCDLILCDAKLVSRHMQLIPVGESVILRPLNGTVFLNQTTVRGDIRVKSSKQIVTIGDTFLAIKHPSEVGWPACSERRDYFPYRGVTLEGNLEAVSSRKNLTNTMVLSALGSVLFT